MEFYTDQPGLGGFVLRKVPIAIAHSTKLGSDQCSYLPLIIVLKG